MRASWEADSSRPKPSWLMEKFWQKQQRRVQPVKNTVPLPDVPLMQGSSHWCRAALAAVS